MKTHNLENAVTQLTADADEARSTAPTIEAYSAATLLDTLGVTVAPTPADREQRFGSTMELAFGMGRYLEGKKDQAGDDCQDTPFG